MLIESKLEWLHQQLAAGTLLYVNAEDQIAIPISKVEIWNSYDGEGHLIANDDQDLDITHITVYGYNQQYEHGMRYPTWNDITAYLPALHERSYDDVN